MRESTSSKPLPRLPRSARKSNRINCKTAALSGILDVLSAMRKLRVDRGDARHKSSCQKDRDWLTLSVRSVQALHKTTDGYLGGFDFQQRRPTHV